MVLGNLVSPGLSPCGAWRVIRRSHVCKLGVGDKGRSERTVREKRAEDRVRETERKEANRLGTEFTSKHGSPSSIACGPG